MPPTVSVIVPNYNHERFLKRRIDGILAQTFTDFELILLDDCSPDGSRAVIENYRGLANVRIVYNDANSGSPFKQWNKGIALASGEYVWIAESDDDAVPVFLESVVPVLDANPAVTMAFVRSQDVSADGVPGRFSDLVYPEVDPGRWGRSSIRPGREELAGALLFDNIVPNASAVVFRRSAFLAAGGADESYRLAGDWKLWISLCLAGDVAFVAGTLNFFRCHPSSVRTKTEKAGLPLAEWLRILKWALPRTGFPDEVRGPINERIYRRWLWGWTHTPMPLGRKIRIFVLAVTCNAGIAGRMVRGVLRSLVRSA